MVSTLLKQKKGIECLLYEYENETHRYYPDIYIKSENRVVEVKSTYTFNKEKEKNLLKRESVLNKNINFNFIIL